MSNASTDPIASQRQALVSVEGIAGYFATRSGSATSADVGDVYDGGALEAEKLASPPSTDNLVVGRPYRPVRDGEVKRRLRPLVGRWRTTVTVQDTDADLSPIGQPDVYDDALLVGVTPPESDAASGDAARIELTFAVRSPI